MFIYLTLARMINSNNLLLWNRVQHVERPFGSTNQVQLKYLCRIHYWVTQLERTRCFINLRVIGQPYPAWLREMLLG